MRQLLSINQSKIKSPVIAPIHSALDGNGTPSTITIKCIYFVETIMASDVDTLIAKLMLHRDEIMFNTHWGQETFTYDWDLNPVWNIANGIRNSNVPINNGLSNENGRQTSGYARQRGYSDLTSPVEICVWLSWELFNASAFTYDIYRIGTGRFSIPSFYYPSASLQDAVYMAGGTYPFYGPDGFILSGTTAIPPADIDGVAAGTYLEVPIPAYAGIFTYGTGSPPSPLYGESNFPVPNPFGYLPV